MKKVFVFTVFILVFISCNNGSHQASTEEVDSTVMMVEDGYGLIYDVKTGKTLKMKMATEIPDGDMKIDENGDTLYFLGGDNWGEGEYISAEKWKEHCEILEKLRKEE
jgi:hypothetical protein